jgi:hypothetical protein
MQELSAIDGSLSRTASTSQDLAQICTMFRSSKSGNFESKMAKFALEHVDGSRKGKHANVKLGSASIDLAAYATAEMTSSKVELSFLNGRVTLRMTLCSHWLQNLAADATSDDSSVASFCTDGESDAGAAREDGIFPLHRRLRRRSCMGAAAGEEMGVAAARRVQRGWGIVTLRRTPAWTFTTLHA